jgi:hypothetical protein
MRLWGVISVVIFAAVFSCEKEKVQSGVMTKAQMADWMMTIYLAESRVLTLSMTRDSAYKIFLPYEDSLLHQRSLEDTTLEKSYQYYLDHPVELEAVYDIIIDSLSLREQRLLHAPITQ